MGGRRRPLLIIVLFVVIVAARFAVDARDAGLLYLLVAPVGLLAAERRLAGGIAGATVATLTVFAWILVRDVELGTLGLLTRIATFWIVGVGVGLLVQESAAKEERLRDLAESAERHRHGLEIHDDIVQGLVVAKMSLDVDRTEAAAEAIDSTLAKARGLVSSQIDAAEPVLRRSEEAAQDDG